MPDNTSDTPDKSAVVPAAVPAAPTSNPFNAVALLLSAVRSSLEGQKRPDQAPRWVRIVRVRQFADPKTGDADVIAKGVMEAMNVVAMGISYMQRFTLDATDLLIQGDAAKALVEVSADLIKAAASKDFINALEVAVGQDPSPSSPLSGVAGVMDTILKIADKVPTPEDLKVIGAQLYALVTIEQLTGGTVDDKTLSHLDIGKSGKLRLVQMGFWKSYQIQNLGKGKPTVDVQYLGGRRLADAASDKLPSRSTGTWGDMPNQETVFDLLFTDANAGKDIDEACKILTALDYTATYPVSDTKSVTPDLANCLRVFQKINGLSVTGKLDNATVCRLMHLDFDAKNLKRAKPYRAELLPKDFDPSKA